MISIEQALHSVKLHSQALQAVSGPIEDCLNCILAEDIYAPISLPPFEQSAMDGYAICSNGTQRNYLLKGESKAGSNIEQSLAPGESIRIFTGAPIPRGCTQVIMQEYTSVKDGLLSFDAALQNQQHIRPIGEQVTQGNKVLSKGIPIKAATIGFLAMLGITEVLHIPRVKVGILCTGDELVPPGNTLSYGQIYESNGIMLEMTLKDLGFNRIIKRHVNDQYESTISAIQELLNQTDVLLISGGISVGDYDFVQKALLELGVEEVFYKVKQKPGKPLFFGKLGPKLVFALPGNPASALSCFYIHALPALHYVGGNTNYELPSRQLPLSNHFKKKGNRPQFLKAYVDNNQVQILDAQQSSMLSSFAISNALVFMPESCTEVNTGDLVTTYIL